MLFTQHAAIAEDSAPAEPPADIGIILVNAESLELSTRALDPEDIIVLKPEDWGAAKSVADALEAAAPANISRTGGEGAMSTVSLRAAGAADTLVMLNGVPVTMPGGTPVDLSLFDLSGVARIEILPGGATIHGTRAMGGVVNIITRAGEGTAAKELELSFGSFGTAKAMICGERKHKSGQEIWQTSAFTTQGDFTFTSNNGDARTRKNNEARRVNFLWQRQDYSEKELKTYFAAFAALRRGVPGFSEFPTLNANLTEETLVCGTDFFSPAEDGKWSAEYGVSLSQGYLRFKDDTPSMGGAQSTRAADTSLHLQGTWTRERKRAKIEVGAAASGNAMAAAEYGDPTRATARAHVVQAWELGDVRLTPSLAVDLCSDNQARATWDFGAQWQAARNFSLVAGAGSSFRHPEFAELYYPSQGFITGNPGLKPERAVSYSVGMRYEAKRASFSATAFSRTQHDAIRFLPVSSVLLKPLNTGESRAQGIEASCTFTLSPGLRASASYALTDAEYTHSGIDFTQTPRNRFSCAIGYENDIWAGNASLHCESSQSADLFGSVRVPAQERLDVAVSRKVGKGRLELAMSNLLDANNRDYWDLPHSGRAFEIIWSQRF